jgi:hypothetical protein
MNGSQQRTMAIPPKPIKESDGLPWTGEITSLFGNWIER